MTTDALTALLERLERAGAKLKFYPRQFKVKPYWELYFGLDLYRLSDPFDPNFPTTDLERAVLLGWAVQEIEAEGYWRTVEPTLIPIAPNVRGMNRGYEVSASRDLSLFEASSRTELEATLTALAEILEAKSD